MAIRTSAIRGLGFAAVFCCVAWSAPLTARAESLPPNEAAAVLHTLRSGAGSITGLQADFCQKKVVPETNETIAASGSVSLRAPNGLRWEYFSPVRSGFVLHGNSRAIWSEAGGKIHTMELREDFRGDEMARFIIACLAFDEQTLRRRCMLDVIFANPPTVRLIPKNEFLRAHLREIILTFSPDGTLPRSMAVTASNGGKSMFTMSNAVRDDAILSNDGSLERLLEKRAPPPSPRTRDGNRGVIFSALLKENTRRLPLLLYVWREDAPEPTLHCVVFTEIFLRLGGIAVMPDGKAVVKVTALDSQAGRILARIGEALEKLSPSAEKSTPRKYAGNGWSMDIVAVDDTK